MPLDHSGGLHQNHRFEATRPHPVEPHPDHSIDGAQPQTAALLSMQNSRLVTERDEFQFQFGPAANPASQPREHGRDECEHARDITGRRAKSLCFSLLSEFSVGTGRARFTEGDRNCFIALRRHA
jgi:hypothetical protein